MIGRALAFLLLDFLLGVIGAVRALQGAHESAYILGMATLFGLCLICLWVAYRALAERDKEIAVIEGSEASSTTHVHAHRGSTVNVYNASELPSGEGAKTGK